MKNVQVSLDELIADLDSAWAEAMKKSESLSKDEEGKAPEAGSGSPDLGSDAAPSPAAGGAPEAPAAEGAPAPEEPVADEGMADEDQGAPEMGEEGQPGQDEMGGEQQLEDQHLSDEELQQVYSSMPPEELERHYMVIRGLLQQQYAKGEQDPNGGQVSSGIKKEEKASKEEMDKCGEMSSPAMKKSEEAAVVKELEGLKKSNQELQAGLEKALQAIKVLAQPTRKAITSEVQFIQKSEGMNTQPTQGKPAFESMSKSELTGHLNDLCKTDKLSKAERDVINGFVLHSAGKEKVIDILRSKK